MNSICKMENISKFFPGVKALDDVTLTLNHGEVHVLLGENGAGKSTLMKILVGIHRADKGKIIYNGREMHFNSYKDAEKAGISIVYQEFNLIPQLTVAENIFFGKQPLKKGTIHWKKMRQDARRILARLGADISPESIVSHLGVAQQQMVEIAKVMSAEAKVVVFDEPTASLTEKEKEMLFKIIRQMKDDGVTMVYISHRLEEIYQIGDRATILRDGQYIGTVEISGTAMDQLITMMVGRELKDLFPRTDHTPGDVVLKVQNLKCGKFVKQVSFEARKGEILGFAGLMGSGRTETMRALFGADVAEAGQIYIEGSEVKIKSPQEAISHGIGFLTEDRKNQGLILGQTISYNISVTNLNQILKKLNGLKILDLKKEAQNVEKLSRDLLIKTPSVLQLVKNLSGGNQQKVILAKWLNRDCKILIFDEPTRGIDVGAKAEIYKLMNELVGQGVCIIMISSELPEILGMSDRIYVMHEGVITGELSRQEADQDLILRYATGLA